MNTYSKHDILQMANKYKEELEDQIEIYDKFVQEKTAEAILKRNRLFFGIFSNPQIIEQINCRIVVSAIAQIQRDFKNTFWSLSSISSIKKYIAEKRRIKTEIKQLRSMNLKYDIVKNNLMTIFDSIKLTSLNLTDIVRALPHIAKSELLNYIHIHQMWDEGISLLPNYNSYICPTVFKEQLIVALRNIEKTIAKINMIQEDFVDYNFDRIFDILIKEREYPLTMIQERI
jgi:hypothetical protein